MSQKGGMSPNCTKASDARVTRGATLPALSSEGELQATVPQQTDVSTRQPSTPLPSRAFDYTLRASASLGVRKRTVDGDAFLVGRFSAISRGSSENQSVEGWNSRTLTRSEVEEHYNAISEDSEQTFDDPAAHQ